MSSDWLTLMDLLDLGLSEVEAAAVLARTSVTGHGGQPIVNAEELEDLLGLLRPRRLRAPRRPRRKDIA
jgi:hypothetical protein